MRMSIAHYCRLDSREGYVRRWLGMRAGGIDMSDNELLELAAKAAGYSLTKGSRGCREFLCKRGVYWNPLEDDGDALRLASKLLIDIGQFPSEVVAAVDIDDHPASFRLLF